MSVLKKNKDNFLVDHTDHIQQLLTKNAGKIIKLPAGTFNIRTLNVLARTQLTISSNTILKGLPTDKPLPILALASDVQVSGSGLIYGNRNQRRYGTGIRLESVQNIIIDGLQIKDIPEQGVQVVASKNIKLINLRIIGCGVKGVDQYQGVNLVISQDIQVKGCYIEDAMHGIQWWGDEANKYCENIWISGNRVRRVTGGIWGNKGRNIIVSNNVTEICQDVGIDFEHSFNCSAIGNTVRDCKNYGLATFYGSERITFTKNRVFQGVKYGHGIGLCGEGTSRQISFIGGYINTKGLASCGLLTVGTNVAQDILVQGVSIVSEGKNGIPIRIVDNNQFQIINNPVISGYSSTGISLEGSSSNLVQGNTIVHNGTDLSPLGERGGIFVYFRSNEYPAQRNRIQGNIIRGFRTGINDDCWGDVNSKNHFEKNMSPNLVHRSSGGNWGGSLIQNRTETKKVMPIQDKQQ